MAKKYYAVKHGLTPGIYLTWEDCKKNIDGVSGAVYKGFATIEEAAAFLQEDSSYTIPSGIVSKPSPEFKHTIPATDGAVAYVDGSYNTATNEYSYGAVIFYEGKEEHFSKKFSNPERASMHNVAGEIEGSMCAMEYCLSRGIKKLTIYYDYEGIEKWCTGAWKANKEGTMAYRDFYRQASMQVDIGFVKVKGHSGDTYNDLADRLAKEALGL